MAEVARPWSHFSSITVTAEDEHHDRLRIFVLSNSVMLYTYFKGNFGVARLNTNDMRGLAELLSQGAEILEGRRSETEDVAP